MSNIIFFSLPHSKEDGIQGYDLLVNAVWPEIVANIEARVPSIFAPGNPNLFHEVRLCNKGII